MPSAIKHLLLTLLAAAGLTLAGSAGAGTADVSNADGDTIRFEYAGDRLRVDMSGQKDAYMVLRDGRVYSVSSANGAPMVIDLSQAWSMFGGMVGSATPDMVAREVVSLQPTGRQEQHADAAGEVYELRFRTEDGQEKQAELVLTDDARAKRFRDAMHHFATTIASTVGQDYQRASDDMQNRLTALDKGVLRYGSDMTVSALSDDAVDATRFELPAAPMDLSNLGSLLGGFGGAPSTGDGDKEAEPAGNAGPASELGKAFGRLFGE